MEQVSAELARTIDTAEIILRRISEEESGQALLAGGWSRKQVLGHLIDSASNNHQRFVRAALADALEFPAYDTPGCVRVQALEDAAWPMLVELWASYNRYLVHVIRHLPAAKLEVVCRIGSNAPTSLRFLAEDYVRHLVHHLHQIGATDCRPDGVREFEWGARMPFLDTTSLPVIERLPGWHGRFFHTQNMTFAHYDFIRGAAIHEHFHPEEEVYEVIDGELEITIDGEVQTARAGLVAIVPSNARHSVKALTDGRVIIVDHPARRDFV